jgi:SET domain-containing protein
MSEIFKIKESGSLGRGLFAAKLIKKGEQILEFKGPIISYEETKKYIPDMGNPIQISSYEYIDLLAPGVLANHSCSPNAGVKNDRHLVAIEDILPGQEIFYDYSTAMEEDDWTIECKCGSPNCRHIIWDFRHLPIEVQKKYLDLNIVQSFIAKKLLANIAQHRI